MASSGRRWRLFDWCCCVVAVAAPATAQPGIFSDGFESGDRCAWSTTVPLPCEGPTTIYQIQQGLFSPGEDLVVDDVSVTGVGDFGFYVQHATGGQYSGIYVFAGFGYQSTFGAISLGSIVQVSGTYMEFNDLSEIDCSTAGYVVQGLASPPVPTPVDVADLQAGVAEPWESVLISVHNVEVSNADLGFGEWSVEDSMGNEIIIDDQLHTYTSQVVLGESFDTIAGPLNFTIGAFKIEPRSDADICAFPPC